jgi:hypothetical protein
MKSVPDVIGFLWWVVAYHIKCILYDFKIRVSSPLFIFYIEHALANEQICFPWWVYVTTKYRSTYLKQ